ncbi:MAG: histidine phosphatase family protein [Anaerolineae bacterium]|nr:histidine phosphatase family protein [Anaerolineae bacterium]
MARQLILVRHSETKLVPGVTASQWALSETGQARCRILAERLADYQPSIIMTSTEPKAIQTGQLVRDILDVSLITAANLHEHDRANTNTILGKAVFEVTIARFFDNPHTLIYGRDTADEAYTRFNRAVEDVIRRYPQGNLVIVTHATVLTLFVSRRAGIAPFPFWQRLGMPAFAVFDLPDLKLRTLVEKID